MKKVFVVALVLLELFAGRTQTSEQKIPIEPSRWYQLNNLDFKAEGLNGLFDGVLSKKVNMGYGKILGTYDSYYAIATGEEMEIESIRFFDGAGSYANTPMVLSVINDKWQRIPIASFKGLLLNKWVGPYPDQPEQFDLKKPVSKFRYLVITSNSVALPDEIEFFGKYTAGRRTTATPVKKIALKQGFGVNAFEWNFEDPKKATVIDEKRMKAVSNFTAVRHYLDWQKIESRQGQYTFNPTNDGGWNYDAMYERCKKDGIEVLVCLKTIPSWMKATYPANLQDNENVPVKYGKDFTSPASYIEQARAGFQFAARYGANKNVTASLLSVNKTQRWANDPTNVVKAGLGLIHYIECDNERDKWWKGRKAYQTGREYAANLSAFYDGNKNTMGPGVGVKNADPQMKVVMAGLAGADIDYVKAMIDWCKQYRGYRPDGSVNVCWDVINYHYYSNDNQSSQNGKSTRGAAPELSGAEDAAKQFVELAHQYVGNMPVWVTETGYDINQGSPQKAIAIGRKSVLETQADWILRTSLLYVRSGVERVFFYQLYDNAPQKGGKYNTSGLINENRARRPAADYLYQADNLLGEYYFKETIQKNPIVDRYELNGKSAYVLVVPDQKGRTAIYTLDLGTAAIAKLYSPRAGQDSMTAQIAKTNNGKLAVIVTETPVFILPGADRAPIVQKVKPGKDLAGSANQEIDPGHKASTIVPAWQ
jgi:endoglucanase